MKQTSADLSKSEYKIIHDTVHGTIKLTQPHLNLLYTPELQRLNHVHQLGLAHLVFPGANHTRLEHSLGTYHIAERMARTLNLAEPERLLVTTSALLHDLGHPPYSHTIEYLLNARLGTSHTDLTRKIILGELAVLDENQERILRPSEKVHEILSAYDIEAETVCKLICTTPNEFDGTLSLDQVFPSHKNQQFFNTKMYLYQIIHSSIDADQIEYLLRDSHYTGVAYGVIDLDRLIQTLDIFNNDLVVDKHGLSAVEGMLVARALMYSSVYFHKTVRIAELMLTRALERLENDKLREFITKSEGELETELLKMGGLQGELINMLLYRKLFKRAYYLKPIDLDDEKRKVIMKLDDHDKRTQKENELAVRAGIPEGHVIIDAPVKELKFSEPRLYQTDIKILDKNVKPLSRYTPLANALKLRNIPEWAMMVLTDKKYIEPLNKVVEKVLFG